MKKGEDVKIRGALRLLSTLLGILAFGVSAGAQADPSSKPSREAEQMYRARWLASDDQVLIAPYYSVAGVQEARLILVSRFAEPIDYEVRALARSGLAYSLGGGSLAPREVEVLDLRDSLSGAGDSFEEGSLEVRYFGDADMTQAWVLQAGATGSLEMPLTNATPGGAREWRSFWDASEHVEKAALRPRFAFHNSESSPVLLTLSWQDSDGDRVVTRRGLGPYQSALVGPPGVGANWKSGTLLARHDGEAGQVAVNAFLADLGEPVASLPMASPSDLHESREFEGLGFPRHEVIRGLLSIHDTRHSGAPRSIRASLVQRTTGHLVGMQDVSLLPGAVRTLDLEAVLPEDSEFALADLRLRVSSEEADLLVSTVAVLSDGTLVDSALIPSAKVHASGTYPVPSPETHGVSTTFLNLGDDTAQLFAHFVSDRGEFALEPIEIAPGALHRLDFEELVAEERIDRLGRRLDPEFEWGFFQWFSRRGSKELLARTEFRPEGSSDTVGFNCFGCCAEFPTGAIIPESVAFDVGQVPPFEAVEYVDTCAGQMGPYYAFPEELNYSAPLSWDGQTVATTDYTNQSVSFQSSGFYETIRCDSAKRTFFGGGDATSDRCLAQHHPEFDPSKSCADQVPNCDSCYECCDKQKEVGECRCAHIGSPKSCTDGVAAACQKCKQRCVGQHIETCSQQIVDC
ncbi:MAG: hypothetical protein ACLF0P_10925 [Thermoanaerobaculia bacterium]